MYLTSHLCVCILVPYILQSLSLFQQIGGLHPAMIHQIFFLEGYSKINFLPPCCSLFCVVFPVLLLFSFSTVELILIYYPNLLFFYPSANLLPSQKPLVFHSNFFLFISFLKHLIIIFGRIIFQFFLCHCQFSLAPPVIVLPIACAALSCIYINIVFYV